MTVVTESGKVRKLLWIAEGSSMKAHLPIALSDSNVPKLHCGDAVLARCDLTHSYKAATVVSVDDAEVILAICNDRRYVSIHRTSKDGASTEFSGSQATVPSIWERSMLPTLRHQYFDCRKAHV